VSEFLGLDLSNYEQGLAGYGTRSCDSSGRAHPESDHPWRLAFQRDRDRIVHSAAFRRLAYKTQVFVNHEGDYYRSRLTHTLEVAQIARTIARAFRVNEDLTEAIVLAHDIGHAPFGHAGQDVLDALMAEHGGFEHNRQSLRIIDRLERRYAAFEGLNLSYETRDSILKHSSAAERGILGFEVHRQPLIEGQIADLADSVAYDAHDVDDALKAGLIVWEQLEGLALWERAAEAAAQSLDAAGVTGDSRLRRRLAVRELLSIQVTDLVATTQAAIAGAGIASAADVRAHDARLVRLSPILAREKAAFQRFLHSKVYQHHRLLRNGSKAERFLTVVFEHFVANPRQLPQQHQEWVASEGLHRGVCDYVSGMTDRYIQREYQGLVEPFVST